MTLLGMELSDAGIMVAAGDPPQLLTVDEPLRESPGFAVREKNRLLVGKAAESKFRLYPRQVSNQFWDQLNTEALEQPGFLEENNAEIAYVHLAQIWENIKKHGDEVVIAVPGFLGRNQLGLILGMANELSMPVSGFVNLAVAASSNPFPAGMLLCLDIHLHRTEITYLRQDDDLSLEETVANTGMGLDFIHKQWIETIAAEFVRTTRFDPLHLAVTEQDVYDRLPGVMADLARKPDVAFDMNGGNQTFSASLSRGLFTQQNQLVIDELLRSVKRLREKYASAETPMALQLTHRLANITGLAKRLEQIPNTHILKLESGAGALGVLRCWNRIKDHPTVGSEASYYSSCPWLKTESGALSKPHPQVRKKRSPTHILYRDLAFPISGNPLYLEQQEAGPDIAFRLNGPGSGDSSPACSIQFQGNETILTNYGTVAITVDDRLVNGSIRLRLGQMIRLGSTGQAIRLIACVDSYET